MNKGAIVQIGSARDIYEQPTTRFVAEFIGQSLWFAGALRGRPDQPDVSSPTTARPSSSILRL